jgi:hypothetical protein
LLAGCPSALAASLTVGALELHYGPGWLRADAEEEARAESVILRQADASALTVMVPRHHTRLRLPEARFYPQLETVWRAQYGQTARVDWLEAGGRRWRMLRRASLDRPGAVVFHLVTVIDGQAHHLLVQTPAAATELPEAVIQLLAGPAVMPDTVATPETSPQATGAALPTGWRLDRILRPQPGPAGLDQAMAQAQGALQHKGGITGLALEAREHGFTASLEGFVWVAGPNRRENPPGPGLAQPAPPRGVKKHLGRPGVFLEIKRPFRHQWDLSWTAPPRLWPDGAASTLVVRSSAASDRAGLVIGLRPLCDPAGQLRAFLDAVERGEADARKRLEAGFAACRNRATGFTQAEITLKAGESSRPISLQPIATRTLLADEPKLLVLSLQPRLEDGSPGQALLEAASVHYIYVREP